MNQWRKCKANFSEGEKRDWRARMREVRHEPEGVTRATIRLEKAKKTQRQGSQGVQRESVKTSKKDRGKELNNKIRSRTVLDHAGLERGAIRYCGGVEKNAHGMAIVRKIVQTYKVAAFPDIRVTKKKIIVEIRGKHALTGSSYSFREKFDFPRG